jgi:hypothetical protein
MPMNKLWSDRAWDDYLSERFVKAGMKIFAIFGKKIRSRRVMADCGFL